MKRFTIILLTIILVFCMTPSAFAQAIQEDQEIFAEPNASPSTHAIIIIPGIMCSTLRSETTGHTVWVNALYYPEIYLNENGTSINDIESTSSPGDYGIFNIYNNLYNFLSDEYSDNYSIVFFDYDWRMSNAVSALDLESLIARNGYSKVILVAHSNGGLVAAKYLANSSANRAKTIACISLGTPYAGSIKSMESMLTGALIPVIESANIYALTDVAMAISRNSYSAYQLLPTIKYYELTGNYPLQLNGQNYSNCYSPIGYYYSWARMSNGAVKPMLQAAYDFHQSLYTNSTHIINRSDVNVFTIAGYGYQTPVMRNDVRIFYTNDGDDTVVRNSAGHGTPDYSVNCTHFYLINNSTVFGYIKTIIDGTITASYNGVSLASTIAATNAMNEDLIINDKGWILGLDNKRINIFTDESTVISVNGSPVSISSDKVYNHAGVNIGSVWTLNNSGRKQYVLYDGNYSIIGSGNVTIEYMDSGYFEQVFEYALGPQEAEICVNGYGSMPVCTKHQIDIPPSHIATPEELSLLNEQ